MRKALTSPGMIVAVLITQFIPLILFPADSFSPTSQVWWLPALLAAMVLIADFQLIVRRTTSLRSVVPDRVRPGLQHHQPPDDAMAPRNPRCWRSNHI